MTQYAMHVKTWKNFALSLYPDGDWDVDEVDRALWEKYELESFDNLNIGDVYFQYEAHDPNKLMLFLVAWGN